MLKKIQQLKNKKGFTLVELIVVIAIVATLTAVIVPLIGRYSTQAAYTMLQDSAKTISNNLTTCMSTYSSKGSPPSCSKIKGKKVNGNELELEFTNASSAELNELSQIIKLSLNASLPANCAFIADIKGGGVEGVSYVAASSAYPSGTVSKNEDFDSAYEVNGEPAGIVGKFANDGFTITE